MTKYDAVRDARKFSTLLFCRQYVDTSLPKHKSALSVVSYYEPFQNCHVTKIVIVNTVTSQVHPDV